MTPEQYIETVHQIAHKNSKICGIYACGTRWRQYLSGLYNTPDRCTCRINDGFINYDQKYDQKVKCCDKCIKCTKCGIPWCPTEHVNSIHSSVGDYDVYRAPHLAEVAHLPWTIQMKYDDYSDELQKPAVVLMTEEEAIAGLKALISIEPHVAAWIGLRALRRTIMLNWLCATAYITDLLERRPGWFAPAGECAKWAENGIPNNHLLQRIDTPIAAEIGPFVMPYYIRGDDNSASTINIDTAIEMWLTTVSDNSERELLIETCARALACTAAQWAVEECEAFHQQEQAAILQLVVHSKHTATDEWITGLHRSYFLHNPFVIWHSRETKCAICKNNKNSNSIKDCTDVIQKDLSPYERVLLRARNIRRDRLRGVFKCAAILLRKVRAIHYLPDIGQFYFDAKIRFENGYN